MVLGAAAALSALTDLIAKSTSSGKSGGSYGFLLILAVFGLVIYLFVLRPQRSRMRKAQQQQRELNLGSQVMTASGLFGTVAAIEDDAVLIEIAPGVTTRWARAAIGRVVDPVEAAGLDENPSTDDGDEPND